MNKIINDIDAIKNKKNFLNQYYWLTKEQENLEEKLTKILIKIENVKATNFSITPKGGQHQEIVDLLHIKEKYQKNLIKKMEKIDKVRVDIEASIDTLDDSKLRVILRYKYLEMYTYKEISLELKKSERHIRRLHDIAVRLLKIVENNN